MTADPQLMPLPSTFYAEPTLKVARALIGKTLARRTQEGLAAGIIVETEAYIGAIDPSAHGYRGRTVRNGAMFGPAGRAYVYFTYGMHHCLNVTTEPEGAAGAVLIRALEPTHGLDLMQTRRGATISNRDLCRGPGRLCQALAVTLAEDGANLQGAVLWIAEASGSASAFPTATSPRIGITRAADWPWRFYVPGSRYVSGRPWQ
jgi:DNA-3-methyladenine glycosylase